MRHVNVPNKLVVMRCVRGATISHDGHLGMDREHEDTVVQSRHQSPFEQCWCKKIHNWNKKITCAGCIIHDGYMASVGEGIIDLD